MSVSECRCVTCDTDLTGRRFYRTRTGARRCSRCQRERREWQGRKLAALRLLLLVGVVVPAVYGSLELFLGTTPPRRPQAPTSLPAPESSPNFLIANQALQSFDPLVP